MHSKSWILMAVLVGAPLAGAAELRVITDDRWCQESNDWNGRRARHCEVREASLLAGGLLKANAHPNGGIHVKGWDRSEIRLRVRVTATGATADEARALAAQVRVETDGGVRVTGPETRGNERQWSASIRLDVPRDAELELEAHNGGIHLGDFTGRARFNTVNGGVHLSGVGGDIQGRTVNGGLHVSLSGSEWEGEGLDVTTTNGGVHLSIPSGYNARLQTSTVNGGVHSDLPMINAGRRPGRSGRRIDTELGRGGQLLRIHTTNGGLRVNQE